MIYLLSSMSPLLTGSLFGISWGAKTLEDGIVGSVLGGAIGDALGHPTEFLSLEKIREKYGPQGVRDFEPSRSHPAGTFTDDTQMGMALANAFLETEGGHEGDLVKTLSREFISWANSSDNNRSPGNSCMKGCQNLERGVAWYAAGVFPSKGCGAVMRVAPVGIVYSRYPEHLAEVAASQTLLTHRHPTAQAAAIVGARIISFALNSPNPQYFKTNVIDFVLKDLSPNAREMVRKLREVPEVLSLDPDLAFHKIGTGWVAEEALAGALYAVLSTDNFTDAVLRAANTEGDSDSIAAITGNIAGALYGARAIPKKWKKEVERSKDLAKIAKALAELAKRMNGPDKPKRDTLIFDPYWHAFPEIRRALYDPQTTLEFFAFEGSKYLESLEAEYGQDIWFDPKARLGNVHLNGDVKDELVRKGKAREEEFTPLDTYIDWKRAHQRLIEDTRLSFYVRLALGIVNSDVALNEVHEEYAKILSHWMLKHGIRSPVMEATITEEALRDFEKTITSKYPTWHLKIRTEEWALEEIRKVNPKWVDSLRNLKGLSAEEVPEPWHDSYEKFIHGLRGLILPSIEKFGWLNTIIERYFIAHAAFFKVMQRE